MFWCLFVLSLRTFRHASGYLWDEVWAKPQLVLLEQVFVCSCVDGFLGHLLSKLSKHICCCLGFVLRACMLALYVAIAYSCLRFHSSRLYSSLHLCGCEDVPSSWATSAFTCARLRVCFSSLPWFCFLSGLPMLVLVFVFLWSSTSTFGSFVCVSGFMVLCYILYLIINHGIHFRSGGVRSDVRTLSCRKFTFERWCRFDCHFR